MIFPKPPLLALAAAWALALAGCGNDPNPAPFQKTRADGTPWVVRYASMGDEVRSLDPQFAYDQVSRIILEPVQDTLLEYHPMKLDPYEVQPCLLESLPERVAGENGAVSWVCRLKKGMMFHDDPCFPGGKGREVVAEDVHFAWQRLCDPAVKCPIFATLAEYVVGMKEAFAAAEKAGAFDYAETAFRGLEVIDSHSFRINLTRSYPQLQYWLAMHFTTPVAAEAVRYYDGKAHGDGPRGEVAVRPLFKFHPVGNGPFRIAEHVQGQRFRLVRNEGYHTTVFPSGGWPAAREATNRPLAGHRLPLVDEMQFTIFREILPIWLLARQGYLDKMAVMKDAANSAITTTNELAPKFRARGMRLEQQLEPSSFYFVINMQDPLLGQNRKLRQALSCAYDAKGYADMLYGGVAPVAQQLLPPGIFGHDKALRNPYGFNLEKGRRLIAEAGYPDGINPATGQPLEIAMDVTATGGEERQLAEYEQRQLEQLGIKVRIIENTFARLTDKENEGNFQLGSSGWGADYPDAENFFFLFYGGNFPPAGQNYSRYKNPEFDRLFDEMQTMENTPERFAKIAQMQAILTEDCPLLLSFHRGYNVIGQPWSPTTHMNPLLEGGVKYLAVDNALRAQKRREWNPVSWWPLGLALGLAVAGVGYAVELNRRRNV